MGEKTRHRRAELKKKLLKEVSQVDATTNATTGETATFDEVATMSSTRAQKRAAGGEQVKEETSASDLKRYRLATTGTSAPQPTRSEVFKSIFKSTGNR